MRLFCIQVYYQKLTQPKLKPEVLSSLNRCEKELDIFNITLVRKQVEMRIEKEGKRKDAEKQKAAETGGGWFSGWGTWLSGNPAPQTSNDLTMNEILGKVEEALTTDEKSKLYNAIDYTENALPLDYPQTYEEYYLSFKLLRLTTAITEFKTREPVGRKILDLRIDDVAAE